MIEAELSRIGCSFGDKNINNDARWNSYTQQAVSTEDATVKDSRLWIPRKVSFSLLLVALCK